MINLLLLLSLLAPISAGDDPKEADCAFSITHESPEMWYDGPNDTIFGLGSTDGTCCSDAAYCIFLSNLTPGSMIRVDVIEDGERTPNYSSIDSSGEGDFCFKPGASCSSYKLNLHYLVTGDWEYVSSVEVEFECSGPCEEK